MADWPFFILQFDNVHKIEKVCYHYHSIYDICFRKVFDLPLLDFSVTQIQI